MKVRVAVVCGGMSSEREVSLRSGEAVYSALKDAGYEALLWKIDTPADLVRFIGASPIDLVFIALHGRFGEDGCIQGFLEWMGIPYTGSGVWPSSTAMNKAAAKMVLGHYGVKTPSYLSFHPTDSSRLTEVSSHVLAKLELPLVVKAACEGSSIGVFFVHCPEQLEEALRNAFDYGNEVVVESFIDGPEVTAAVIGNDKPRVLPLIEIVSKTGVYDYDAKYSPGASDHIIPARLLPEIVKEVEEMALESYRIMGCRGFARVDFMIHRHSNRPFVLEVNTVPGMTATSLFPDAARAAGMDFSGLVDQILKLALEKNLFKR